MTIQPNKCANGAKGAYFPWVAHLVLVVQVLTQVRGWDEGTVLDQHDQDIMVVAPGS